MDEQLAFPPKDKRVQRFATTATVAFFAFVLGFVPMWLTGRTRAGELETAQQAVRRMETESALAAAAIHARRGEYEPARVAASTFYTQLQSALADVNAAGPESQSALREILAERDEIITLLARGDAAVAERLANAYVSYRRATGQES